MEKTLFIASFPDLGSLDFSKSSIKVGNVDNSDFYFLNSSNYIHSYVEDLKNKVGDCDVFFVPCNHKIISRLSREKIKCIVLYPNIKLKDRFLKSMKESHMDEDFISMVRDSWDFVISKLDKRDYDFKFVMGEEDSFIGVLQSLLEKKDVLGVSKEDLSLGVSEQKVEDLFSYCLLREDEFSDGKPSCESVFCEGIKFDYYFNSDRLKNKKEEISHMINMINSVEDGVSAFDLNKLRDGECWTNDDQVLERVMVLGISNGDLIIPFSREWDSSLKDGVPYVIKSDFMKGRRV